MAADTSSPAAATRPDVGAAAAALAALRAAPISSSSAATDAISCGSAITYVIGPSPFRPGWVGRQQGGLRQPKVMSQACPAFAPKPFHFFTPLRSAMKKSGSDALRNEGLEVLHVVRKRRNDCEQFDPARHGPQ